MGDGDAPESWTVAKHAFLRKPDAAAKKGIKGFKAIALTAVMCKALATCAGERERV